MTIIYFSESALITGSLSRALELLDTASCAALSHLDGRGCLRILTSIRCWHLTLIELSGT